MTKNRFILGLAVLMSAACAMFASCVNEHTEVTITASKARTVQFNICEMDTKTAFGQGQDGVYPTLWTENDAAVKLALNYTEAAEVVVVPSEDHRRASFSAEIDAGDEPAPYTFYAVSPSSAARALSPSRQAWNVTIPSVQTPLAGSVDESAMLLAAASQPSDRLPSSVDIHFSHLTAYGRMSFKNLALGDAKVSRVEITATAPFVGDWYWDCSGEHALADNGASSTLTLNTSEVSDIWFACAPVDMSGQIGVFTVYTDKGAFIKELEFPQGRKFNAGRIAVFSVDMSGVEMAAVSSDDFVLVTKGSDLQDGDEILILNSDENYAISTGQDTNNRAAAAIKVNNHKVSYVPDDVQVINLVAGITFGTWYLKAGTGYLANAMGNKNRLLTISSINNTSTWTISIASSGVATVKAGAGDRKILRFNANGDSPLFACYSSGQKDIVIYRKSRPEVKPVEEDPLTENSLFGFYHGADTRTYVAGTDQIVRKYSASGEQTFAIVNPAVLEELVISGYKKDYVKGDKFTVTVSWRKGKTRIVAGEKFTVKVVREDGPVVWLGDGSGNGFIIKK